ncbi:MAG: glycine--tRNA ligase [Planctomycetes bacterium]|nr:glycine--tRNA ligase [Planctomycetota bacterium]MBI3833217.1 glycine--tRNA ligase [Planctomycetota bacterium]
MEKIVALCRRRGFIFGSSEIYGGIGGFWDYGPLGCELKRNIKEAWWSDMVRNPPIGPKGVEFQMVGVDCSIIMNPKVWEASGHVGGFSDPMRDCKECKLRYRSDYLIKIFLVQVDEIPKESTIHSALDKIAGKTAAVSLLVDAAPGTSAADHGPAIKRAMGARKVQIVTIPQSDMPPFSLIYWIIDGKNYFMPSQYVGTSMKDMLNCPNCGGELTDPRAFNLMFQTYVGALQEASNIAYLRPETAQGIFANFKNVMDSSRVKIPFGIAQMGKAFRNEINPRNYTFRSREFEQMEIEFFCKGDEFCKAGEVTPIEWWEFWRDVRINWYKSLGLKSEHLRPRNQTKEELAHYSKACTDIEYLFPFSDEPQELEGVAHRGTFDLTQHQTHSGKDMTYFDDETRERFTPTVIEPSAGADRFTLAVICEAYSYDESRASPEFMRFHPRLAPIKAAVFPLVAKDGLPEIAEPIYREIKKHFPAQYDAKQSIGKRYARMDEAGTPFCFTIDGQSKEDSTVTVRNRDDASQIRIDKSRCLEYLREQLRL